MKNVKLSDDKNLGGKGRLTDDKIDQLKRYYGLAIRRNLTSVDEMKDAVWATYYHTLSSNEEPNHKLCPQGNDSWCGYKKALALNTTYHHNHTLPKPVMDVIKPVSDLTNIDLLKRCLLGQTQNLNASFNSCIWQRVKKTGFVGLHTLKLGVPDAVIAFNDASIVIANVLERIGIKPGKYTVHTLKNIDRVRISKADKEAQEGNKKLRVKRIFLKRKREDPDHQSYCPGGF